MSAAVNSIIGAQLGSIGRGAEGSESRQESGASESLTSQRTKPIFGSIAVEIAARGAASNRPPPISVVGSELMVGADT